MLFVNFLEEVGPFRKWIVTENWHRDFIDLAVAQHHGLATRLLDWSRNPLAALWFAVSSEWHEDVNGAVFIVDTMQQEMLLNVTENPFEIDRVVFFPPPPIVERVWNQTSWFSLHPKDASNKPMALPESSTAHNSHLIIPVECKSTIRNELHLLSIDELRLFYDLDGLCQHVNWFSTSYAKFHFAKAATRAADSGSPA